LRHHWETQQACAIVSSWLFSLMLVPSDAVLAIGSDCLALTSLAPTSDHNSIASERARLVFIIARVYLTSVGRWFDQRVRIFGRQTGVSWRQRRFCFTQVAALSFLFRLAFFFYGPLMLRECVSVFGDDWAPCA
jgi:hypothetical protein